MQKRLAPPATDEDARAQAAISRRAIKLEESRLNITALPERYKKSMKWLSDMAKFNADRAKVQKLKTITVHVIGVGGEEGPQVSELIQALKPFASELVVHVSDIRKDLAEAASRKAGEEFPDVRIISHNLDVTAPTPASEINEKADFVICTNVIQHVNPAEHRWLGFFHVSSLVKVGGYVLIGGKDAELPPWGKFHKSEIIFAMLSTSRHQEYESSLPDFGLEPKAIIEEQYPLFEQKFIEGEKRSAQRPDGYGSPYASAGYEGILLEKTGEPTMAFKDLWKRIVEMGKAAAEREEADDKPAPNSPGKGLG